MLATLLPLAAGLLGWCGARYLNVPGEFGALAPHDSIEVTKTSLRRGATLPRRASQPGAPGASRGKAARTDAANASKASAEPTPHEQLAALRKPLAPEAQNDPFGVLSWLPPPPPPPPAPVAPPVEAARPVAPPLPFSYVGRLNRDSSKPQVFLTNGDQLLITSPGDLIENRYRFESIDTAEAVFTYLPLNERQVLTIETEGQTK